MILRNSEEGFGYGATDLATIDERVNDLGARTCLYVVDARQSLHFEQVFRAARKSVAMGQPVALKTSRSGPSTDPMESPSRRQRAASCASPSHGNVGVEARLFEAGMGSELNDQEESALPKSWGWAR